MRPRAGPRRQATVALDLRHTHFCHAGFCHSEPPSVALDQQHLLSAARQLHHQPAVRPPAGPAALPISAVGQLHRLPPVHPPAGTAAFALSAAGQHCQAQVTSHRWTSSTSSQRSWPAAPPASSTIPPLEQQHLLSVARQLHRLHPVHPPLEQQHLLSAQLSSTASLK